MESLAPLIALLSLQATYGPPVPVAPPVKAAPAVSADTDYERLLTAQGVSPEGLAALRGLPLPPIAQGATRAAQCAVEQLTKREPLPLDELKSALEERDATAAAQAHETTQYLVAALARLRPADQRVLLAVVGTGAGAIGAPPPPRPGEGRIRRADAARGPGAGPDMGPPPGRGGGGGSGGPGGPRLAERGGPPPGPPARSMSACERLL